MIKEELRQSSAGINAITCYFTLNLYYFFQFMVVIIFSHTPCIFCCWCSLLRLLCISLLQKPGLKGSCIVVMIPELLPASWNLYSKILGELIIGLSACTITPIPFSRRQNNSFPLTTHSLAAMSLALASLIQSIR